MMLCLYLCLLLLKLVIIKYNNDNINDKFEITTSFLNVTTYKKERRRLEVVTYTKVINGHKIAVKRVHSLWYYITFKLCITIIIIISLVESVDLIVLKTLVLKLSDHLLKQIHQQTYKNNERKG